MMSRHEGGGGGRDTPRWFLKVFLDPLSAAPKSMMIKHDSWGGRERERERRMSEQPSIPNIGACALVGLRGCTHHFGSMEGVENSIHMGTVLAFLCQILIEVTRFSCLLQVNRLW